jgi:hypothetical protein
MLTGFDEERGAVRSFYREDIERYLDINFNETRRNTTKADPMFRRLRTARFLKPAPPLTAQRWVIPAWLRVSPASISSACATKSTTAAQWRPIPAELLGLSKADRMAIARQVIDSLGVR